MKRLLLVLLCLFCIQCFPKGSPVKEAARLEQDIFNGRFPDRATYALEVLLKRAAYELGRKGYKVEGEKLLTEWRTKHKRTFYTYAVATMRDIGDHASLNQWLAEKYELMELILGVALCKNTHLSDIKTFLYTPPIVFRPSSFPMDMVGGERIDEYRRHFNEGSVYYGLAPVTLYWVVSGVCLVGTSGIGSVVCGLAAGVGERLFASFVGGKISDWVFNKANGTMMSNPNDWDYWSDTEDY